jgi:hypothetical protein
MLFPLVHSDVVNDTADSSVCFKGAFEEFFEVF